MILHTIEKEFVHHGIFKKMKMKTISSLAILFLVVSMGYTQSGKLKKADDYYNKLSYNLALDLYKDLLSTSLSSAELKAKLAHCYMSQGDLKNANETYAKAVKSGDLPKEHYFYYAQSLKQTGNYAESDKWMQAFYDKNNSDKRAQSFVQNKSYLERIEKEGIHFSIANTVFNSTAADFGAYEYAPSAHYFLLSSRRKSLIKNYWTWNGTPFLDLYKVNKSTPDASYFSPSVNTNFHEGPLCFNQDNSKVYFTRNNISKGSDRRDDKGIQNLKLFVADVSKKDGVWSNIRELSINSKAYSVGHPTLSADGKTLYFVSDMPGGFGGADLYKVTINGDGTIGKQENLGDKVNTEGQEMFPWISSEGLLFFSSNGHIGLGGLDVLVCTTENGKLDNLSNVGRPLNSQRDDFAFTFNADGKSGHFSSNREGGKGDDDVYSFQMTRPFVFKITLTGIVIDKGDNTILAGSEVILKDKNGKVIATVIADKNGAYSFTVEPGKEYQLVSTNDNYTQNMVSVSIAKDAPKEVKADVMLEKVPTFALYGLIKDSKSGQILSDVTIKIIDKKSGNLVYEGKTPSTGDFSKGLEGIKLNDELSYTISLAKEGYLTKVADFKHKVDKPGVINVHEKLDVSIGKVEIGTDLATLIDIKPIYFDLGKYAIRKDAAVELEKIVKVMNEYPTMVIQLGSHTDCRSSKDFNMKLSSNRAKASADYIKRKIKNPERIYGKGFGESKLKVNCPCEGAVKSNCSEEEHQKNRRTEFIIMKM